MKKVFLFILLLIVIILTFSFSIIYYLLNLNPNTYSANSSFRKQIISQPLLRKIFKLHQIGDARYDFAKDSNYAKLNIIIYYQNGEILNSETIEEAVSEMKMVIKKPDGINIKRVPIMTSIPNYTTDKELDLLIKKYPVNQPVFGKTTTLQIFILKSYEDLGFTGMVKDASNIFIFKNAIKSVSDQQSSTRAAEVSTILHEFAHLLGADHVQDETCILNAKIENMKEGFPTVFSTTYCSLDLKEIKKALSY